MASWLRHLQNDLFQPKIARKESLEYCRDKLIIKPKKMPYDQKQVFSLFPVVLRSDNQTVLTIFVVLYNHFVASSLLSHH